MNVIESFQSISRPALKYKSYLVTYQTILEKYKNTKITFVEIGILGGGSLQAWKKYFHPDSRIIGIDLNNDLKKELENEGFEIYIGDQSNPNFWDELYSKIGNIDILLDDGGHTNLQQGVTLLKSIPMINDNGLIIIEDVHTSYMEKFLNPSKYSFINFSKFCIDIINDRFHSLNKQKHTSLIKNTIHYISFFESIIVFHINRKLCSISDEKRFGKHEIILPIDVREDGHKINLFNSLTKNLLKYLPQSFKKNYFGKSLKYLFYFDKKLHNENTKFKQFFKKID
jgi:hypothetical protein